MCLERRYAQRAEKKLKEYWSVYEITRAESGRGSAHECLFAYYLHAISLLSANFAGVEFLETTQFGAQHGHVGLARTVQMGILVSLAKSISLAKTMVEM
jgi:hypothetical protein